MCQVSTKFWDPGNKQTKWKHNLLCRGNDIKTASTITTSIVHSKLDYCNLCITTFQVKKVRNRLQVIQNSLARAVVKLPNSVTSLLFTNLYIGLKSMNALNINFFLLPIKTTAQPTYLHKCTAWSLFSPLVLLAPHLLSPFLDHLHLL